MEVVEVQAGGYSEIRRGWRILLAGMLGSGLGMPPVPFYTIGIFAPIFAKEFGWSFAVIFGGLMVTTATFVIGGPLVGWILDRVGSRLVASASLCGMGLSYMLFALSSGSLVQYYATWFLVSITGLGASPISITRAVNRSFDVRRGLALGITLAGTGLFAFAVKPLADIIIMEAGWRAAIVMIGLLPIMVGAPMILWAFPRAAGPEASKLQASTEPSIALVTGLAAGEAFRARAFWIMAVVAIPVALASTSPLPNMENILRAADFAQPEIIKLTSIIGITIILGRLIGGWLLDRIWAPMVSAAILTLAAAGSLLLSQSSVSPGAAFVAISLLGLAAGVEMDLLSYLVARYIGMRSYGLVYATIFGIFAVGAGAGPSLLGYAYDRMGSYLAAMIACAGLFVFAALLLLCLGRYPDLSRKTS